MALGMVDDRCELLGVNGDAGGDEGRITTAEGAFCSDKDAEGVFCADKDAEGVGAQSARRRTWRQELPGVQHRAHGVMGNAGGDEGRNATADVQVSPESAPMTSVSHGVMGKAGGDEGRITTADLQVTPEAAPMDSEKPASPQW